MTTKCYLGIDAGTQGLSALLTDEQMNVVAAGEGEYQMVPGLGEGHYEQLPEDWSAALVSAMQDLRQQLRATGTEPEVLAVGISGQMHGETLSGGDGKPLGPARLWCDSRNDAEGQELTTRFGVKVPKRMTVARWLWTIRNRPDLAKQCRHMTTPAGYLAYVLTGEWTLGIGDAAGMFPIDQQTLGYRRDLAEQFDTLTQGAGVAPLADLLPEVRRAGELAGRLSPEGAELLGLPEGTPVAPAEGDQPASLAGARIGEPGSVAMSFGTSVVANSVSDRPFEGVHPAVDHFCAPDGKPINMVCLRNGTTFMNAVVEMFGAAAGGDRAAGFAAVLPQLLQAEPDCGGLLALPFMDDEAGLGVARGGTAMVVGLNQENATPGNVAKAALLSTAFNLMRGTDALSAQGHPRNQILLSGGMTKTPELGQLIADVFRTTVLLSESSEEGTALGAALMARFSHARLSGETNHWAAFLAQHNPEPSRRFEPDPDRADLYRRVYARYQQLLKAQPTLDAALHRGD